MHVLCPTCRNPIEVVTITARQEINCPSCGSSFRLEGESTVAWAMSAARKLGKFELLDEVGKGSFGTVYKARDPELDRVVAIKVPRAGHLAGPQELDRFLREARSVAQLRHPTIVSIHEVGQEDGVPFLVSDFVAGVTLSDLLSGRRPSFVESVRLVAEVADALDYAHRHGVVHRDVKPSNILLGDDGAPHVMDFGLAKREAAEITMTVEGQVLGTPAYMSPEQARGEGHQVDGRSDVYSLGVIFYQLLTSELPFRGTTRMLLHQVLHDDPRPPRKLNDRIPRDLETICLKAMAKEAARRYASARALADDLRRFLGGEPIAARPMSAWERGLRWTKRRPAAAALLVVSGLAALALGALGVGLVYHARLQSAYDAEAAALQAEETQRQETEQALAREGAAHKAEQEQRKKAEAAQAATKAALERADRAAYFHRILLADLALRENNIVRARLLLDEAKPAQRGWEWHYLNGQCHVELLTMPGTAMLLGHAVGRLIAFSPDGRTLAAAKGHSIRLSDASTGQEVLALPGHNDTVSSLAFRPDGRRLASVSRDGTIKVWDLATTRELLTIKGNGKPFLAVAYSPDGRRLYTAGDGPATVWDAETGREVLALKPRPGSAIQNKNHTRLALSPDGQRLALFGPPEVQLWDTTTGHDLLAIKGVGILQGLAFTPDGRLLATTAMGDKMIRLWDLATGRQAGSNQGHADHVFGITYSLDGRLASASADRTVKVWGSHTEGNIRTYRGHASTVVGVDFSPDGRRLASLGVDGQVKVWDASANPEATWLPVKGRWFSLAFHPDGRRIATAPMMGHGVNNIQTWDVVSGRVIRGITSNMMVWGLAFSPDGQRLAGAGSGLRVWDANSGSIVFDLKKPDAAEAKFASLCAAFRPDGRLLASVEGNGLVVWDAVTGQKLFVQTGNSGLPKVGITFSPDGRRLAWGGEVAVRVCDSADGQNFVTLKGHTGPVTGVAYSPDGRLLASGSKDQTVKVWDARDGRLLQTLQGHAGEVFDVAFHPDGQRLASAGNDRTVKVWDVMSGQETLALQANVDRTGSLAFSADGRRLACGGWRAVSIWDAPQQVAEARAEGRRRMEQTQTIWHQDSAEAAERAGQWFAAEFHLRRLLDAEPDHGGYRLRHGQALARLGKPDQAKQEFVKALASPKAPTPVEGAEAHAELAQWKEAARLFAKAAEARTAERRSQTLVQVEIAVAAEEDEAECALWHKYALLALYLGDSAGYRKTCVTVLERFGKTTFPATANAVAWMCALGPEALPDLAPVLRLSEEAVKKEPNNLGFAHTLGYILYRAGRYEEAEKQSMTTLQATFQTIQSGRAVFILDWFALPMATHRMGKTDEARKMLDEPALKTFDPGKLPTWVERVEFLVHRREAEQLLAAPLPADKKRIPTKKDAPP